MLFDVGQVDKDAYHVTLLTIVAFLVVTVHDQILSLGDIHLDVVELASVSGVCKQVVPRDARDGFLRQLPCVKSIDKSVSRKSEFVRILEVLTLLDNPVSVAEFHRLEEVW